MDLATSMALAADGMRAQTSRMRVITENIANAGSTSPTPEGLPYRRKIATMRSEFDRTLEATTVEPGNPVPDNSDFQLKYDPGNPAADKSGYIKLPNVNPLIEVMDMREAQRAYEADITAMESSKAMLARTIDLLKR